MDADQHLVIAKKLQELTGRTTIELRPVIDPSLLGGFIIDVGSERYDYSRARRMVLESGDGGGPAKTAAGLHAPVHADAIGGRCCCRAGGGLPGSTEERMPVGAGHTT